MGSVVGIGSIVSSGSFVIPLNPKNTIIIVIDATAAPIPSDGPCINKIQIYFANLVFYEG
jgi:hypothetical protein